MKRIVSFREDPGLLTSDLVHGFADELRILDAPVIKRLLQDRGSAGSESAEEDSSESGRKSIEDRLGRLKMELERQTEAMERNADGFRDEPVGKLKELYTLEGSENDKLVFEPASLREK